MAVKAATLVDNFATDDTTKWPNRQGGVTISGTLSLACVSSFSALSTGANAYDLTSSYVYCQIIQLPQAGGQAGLRVANPYTSNFNDMQWLIDNAGLHALLRVAGSADTETVLTYDSTAHKWLRLRDDGTNLLWDTSPDGSTWTTRRSSARTLTLNASQIELATGSADSTTRQPFIVDNVNTLGTTPVSRTGVSSATGSTSGTVQVVSSGTSTGVGSTSGQLKTAAAYQTLTGVSSGVGSTSGSVRVRLTGVSSGVGATSGIAVAAGVYIPTIGDVQAGKPVKISPIVVGLNVISLTWTCNQPGFAFTQNNGVLSYIAPTTIQGVSVVWTLTALISTSSTPTANVITYVPGATTTKTVTTTHNILRHTGSWMVGAGGVLYPLYLGGGVFVVGGSGGSGTATYDVSNYDLDYYG